MKYYIDTIKGLLVTTRHLIANTLGRAKAGVVTIEYPEQKLTYRPNFRGLHRLTTRPDGAPKCVACYMCETICPAYCIHIEAEEVPGTQDASSAGELGVNDSLRPASPERAGGSGGHGEPSRQDAASAGEFISPERAGGSGGNRVSPRYIEKRPKVFTIDELRCVVCGLCVEACPEDAIRMDTGVHPPPASSRADFLYRRDMLMSHKGVGTEPPSPAGGGRRK